MIALLDVASNLGLRRPEPGREPGVRYAPWQLRTLGLVARLGARDAGAVAVPAYTGDLDAETAVLNALLLKRCGLDLSEALAPILEAGQVPLVLGGDCSVLAGALLALRRRGRFGLLYLDGHRDLLTPERSQHGAAAGMALALALGHGPESLVSLGGYRPLVDAPDVLLLGYRDLDRWYDPALLQLQQEAMQAADVTTLRREGIDAAFRARLDHLRANGIDGLWIHLDVDVLDPAVMPAVDCPEPDGLLADELVQLLDLACASGMVAGMHVTIYDPERDADQRCGRTLVDILARGLARLCAPAPVTATAPTAST
jgi:arginase